MIPLVDGSNKEYLFFEADKELVSLAERRKGKVLKVVSGIIATGDQFVQSEKRIWLKKNFNAASEMEGVAVAQICITNNVPFVVIEYSVIWLVKGHTILSIY